MTVPLPESQKDAACNPTSRLFFPRQWVVINTEGTPYSTISSKGFHRSHPEKSIMVFTNQSPQRFVSHLRTALTWSTMWTSTLYLINTPSSRPVTILIISPCSHPPVWPTHTLEYWAWMSTNVTHITLIVHTVPVTWPTAKNNTRKLRTEGLGRWL